MESTAGWARLIQELQSECEVRAYQLQNRQIKASDNTEAFLIEMEGHRQYILAVRTLLAIPKAAKLIKDRYEEG